MYFAGKRTPPKNVRNDAIKLTCSQLTQTLIRVPGDGDLEPFGFAGQRYFFPIYDIAEPRVLFIAGRQVGKTGYAKSPVLMADGRTKALEDVRVGDEVVSLATDMAHTTSSRVLWKSELLTKKCLRVRTRLGHKVDVATTHPLRKWGRWVPASQLVVGDRIASVRRVPHPANPVAAKDDHIIFLAYMVADGHTGRRLSFSKREDSPVLNEFLAICGREGWTVRSNKKAGSLGSDHYVTSDDDGPEKLIQSWGLHQSRAATKKFPDWAMQLSARQTALLINRLWSCDGYAGIQGSKYELEYSTISYELARQVQSLLWRFGIPTHIREAKPRVYVGTDKVGYRIRVETQEGVRTFLTEIGALGKTENLPLPHLESSSNRDTFPIEITEDIQWIAEKKAAGGPSLYSAGLRLSPKYPLTFGKLVGYVDFFSSNPDAYPQDEVCSLAEHLTTDLIWDEITSIEELGELPCYDVEVAVTNNYVIDGLISHNSSYIGNVLMTKSIAIWYLMSLYVSPTILQTSQFSNDRIRMPIAYSPDLKTFFADDLVDRVNHKMLITGSEIRLRNAFLNADRIRGIRTDVLGIDELQNILSDLIPIIEQTQFRSKNKIRIYSGTPLGQDNTLWYYWRNYSTQNEWVIPCDKGSEHPSGKRHWNIAGEGNLPEKAEDKIVCELCHKSIHPMHPQAQWASMQKNPKIDIPFNGFRIPQIITPMADWAEIMDDYKRYPIAQFKNEVLGEACDSGSRPITKDQIIQNCHPDISMTAGSGHKLNLDWFRKHSKKFKVWMGVDWGTSENKSHTYVSLGGYFGLDRFIPFYLRRLDGKDAEPRRQLSIIKSLKREFNVSLIGSDYGGGFDRNDDLTREYGANKVFKYQYAANPKQKIKWDRKRGRYIMSRSDIMSDIFEALKRGNFYWLPREEEITGRDSFSEEVLGISAEFNSTLRIIQYNHSPGSPDDGFHSLLYLTLVSSHERPIPEVILPGFHIGTKYDSGEMGDYGTEIDFDLDDNSY